MPMRRIVQCVTRFESLTSSRDVRSTFGGHDDLRHTVLVRNQNYKFAGSGTAITFTGHRKSRRTRHFRFGHTGPSEFAQFGAAFSMVAYVDHGEELMTDSKRRDLARFGAEARLRSLEEERKTILGMFPELLGLAQHQAAAYTTPVADRLPLAATPLRKRRSLAMRKAVGEKMRRYWAT